MSPRLGQISFERDRRTMLIASPEPSGRRDYSEETAREIDVEVRRIIDEQIERVAQLLEVRKTVLMQAARVLIARETISGVELKAIVESAGAALGPVDPPDDDANPEPAAAVNDSWVGG